MERGREGGRWREGGRERGREGGRGKRNKDLKFSPTKMTAGCHLFTNILQGDREDSAKHLNGSS